MRTIFGYLDPGSSSVILQLIAGGIAAIAVSAKLFWDKLLRFLRIRRDEPDAQPREHS
jgi:hypothetical protein